MPPLINKLLKHNIEKKKLIKYFHSKVFQRIFEILEFLLNNQQFKRIYKQIS